MCSKFLDFVVLLLRQLYHAYGRVAGITSFSKLLVLFIIEKNKLDRFT